MNQEGSAKERIVYTKKCLHCQNTFTTLFPRQKFCVANCRKEHHFPHSKQLLHWQILNRDNFRCQYCGRTPTQHGVTLVIDHIKPRADGGKTELGNLVTACEECNSAKFSRPLRHEAEFKKRLHSRHRFIKSQTAFNFLLTGQDET